MAKSPPPATPSLLERQLAALAENFIREALTLIGRSAPADVQALDARRLTPQAVENVMASPMRRRRRWPTCGETGCAKAYYPASGTARQCYDHFLRAGGKHPSKRRVSR